MDGYRLKEETKSLAWEQLTETHKRMLVETSYRHDWLVQEGEITFHIAKMACEPYWWCAHTEENMKAWIDDGERPEAFHPFAYKAETNFEQLTLF